MGHFLSKEEMRHLNNALFPKILDKFCSKCGKQLELHIVKIDKQFSVNTGNKQYYFSLIYDCPTKLRLFHDWHTINFTNETDYGLYKTFWQEYRSMR